MLNLPVSFPSLSEMVVESPLVFNNEPNLPLVALRVREQITMGGVFFFFFWKVENRAISKNLSLSLIF